MNNSSSQSLLYNFAGHRCGGGAAPSNDLAKIGNSKMEISDDGPSGEEISALMMKEEIALGGRRNERIRSIALDNGLSQRSVDRCEEG